MAGDSGLVKDLRQKTGAGIMDCKQALVESDDDVDKAIDWLRQKGLASAGKKMGRATNEGVIASYIHAGSKVGVLVEVNCETDFVARTEAFQALVKALGMQVAAANPAYVAREDVPGEVVEKEREIYRGQLADQKKPAQVIDKIIEGKLEKFFTEQCLLEQPFIKDATGKTKVRDLVDGVNAKTGERIVVKRFARFQVGEAG
jgi:elongation factor Ts